VRCQPKHSEGASPREEVVCPRTNIQPKVPSRGLIELSTISCGSTLPQHLHVLHREIPDGAVIAAMDPISGSATHWTGCAQGYPFAGEDQTLGLSTVGKQAEAVKMGKKDI